MASTNSIVEPSFNSSTQLAVSHGISAFGDGADKITGYRECTSPDVEKTADLEQQQLNNALIKPETIFQTSRRRNGESAGISEHKRQRTDDFEQLRNDNQALRTENQLLKNQLKSTLEWQVHMLSKEPVGLTSEQEVVEVETTHDSLPPEILRQIFDNITDAKTLLAARVVCASWKTLIDNTPSLMRRLTFLVIHPRLFLHLTNIVQRVQSISFANVLPGTEEDLQKLIGAIAPNLQSVAFDFDLQVNWSAVNDERERIACSVLRQCEQLNELRLLGRQKDFMRALKFDEPVFTKVISLTINALDAAVGSIFSDVILSLPKLSDLVVFYHLQLPRDPRLTRDYVSVLTPICNHMVKYPGVLKKFAYRQDDFCNKYFGGESGEAWTKLFLMAGEKDVVVSSDIPFHLGHLVAFDETEEHSVNLKNCAAITQGKLEVQSLTLTNQHRVELCVNLEELQVYARVNGATTRDYLSILWRLKKLRKLIWLGSDSLGTPAENKILEQVFLGRLPLDTVRSLAFEDVTFDSTGPFFSSLNGYFPNLVHLRLCRTTVPEDLFVSLRRIEGLVTLALMSIPSLLNSVFLAREEANETKIPTFALLTKLNALTICECQNLTDCCLKNGILTNPALEALTLLDCPGFNSDGGYRTIMQGRLKKIRVAKEGRYSGFTFTLS